ncbi:MAG: ABC transporter ATP-binding protein [Bacillota bacterium]
MPKALISIMGVTCTYGSTPALEGVSFEVSRGEKLGIIGPNGSGKSTLLKAMSRVLPPHMGQVVLSERDLYTLPPREVARRLAVVGQESRVDFEFTALEVVLMGRLPHLGRFERESDRDVDKACEAMRLTATRHLARRAVTELSGGERQRVLIARALAQDPEILLLDEPTSHLDIGHQVEILDLLEGLNREKGLTLISVFHDLNLAARYCTCLLLLSRGKIHALGTPDEVMTAGSIRQVYGSEVLLTRHPVEGTPHVILLSRGRQPRAKFNFRVHVIGGGGMASALLERLSLEGFKVTSGALNKGDADWQKAMDLGLPVVEAAPFSPVSIAEAAEAGRLMLQADLVIIGAVPFGPGNLPNLEAAAKARDQGVPVMAVARGPTRERDYTDGAATRLFQHLEGCGMVTVPDDEAARRAAVCMAQGKKEGNVDGPFLP